MGKKVLKREQIETRSRVDEWKYGQRKGKGGTKLKYKRGKERVGKYNKTKGEVKVQNRVGLNRIAACFWKGKKNHTVALASNLACCS